MNNLLLPEIWTCNNCGPQSIDLFYVCKVNYGNRYICKKCKIKSSMDCNNKDHPAYILKLKEYREKIRREVISYYSQGEFRCAKCLELEYTFLCIDHLKNDGFLLQGKKYRAGMSLYRWLIKNDLPDGFQVLCHNCNFEKELQTIISDSPSSRSITTRKNRELVFSYYGSECLCCRNPNKACLCIDHIAGGGNKHRESLGNKNSHFYDWLVKNGFPSGFRTLCHNCNFSYGAFGKCSHGSLIEDNK